MTPVAVGRQGLRVPRRLDASVVATRYKLEEVKRTSIERAVVRMVVTHGQDRSRCRRCTACGAPRQRLAVQLPAGAEFDAQPLRINGRPATLEKGRPEQVFRAAGRPPATTSRSSWSFATRCRATAAGSTCRSFPRTGARPWCKEYLCVYLPETRTLLGVRGPWTEEFRWRSDRRCDGSLMPIVETATLLVGMGPRGSGVVRRFRPTISPPTAGCTSIRRLRPAKPPEGSLEMTTIDDRWLDGLVFAATVLLGLCCCRPGCPLARWRSGRR